MREEIAMRIGLTESRVQVNPTVSLFFVLFVWFGLVWFGLVVEYFDGNAGCDVTDDKTEMAGRLFANHGQSS